MYVGFVVMHDIGILIMLSRREVGLEVNAEKTKYSTCSFLVSRMRDKILTERHAINHLKG
jgi:hypothetical protein